MSVSIQELLASPVINRVISRIKTPLDLFQEFFKMKPGQGANESISGYHFGWDIFDKTRVVARGRARGQGPGTTAPKVIGHASAVMYRAHEKIHLSQEQIFRTRPLGSNWGTVDARGENYIRKQEEYLAQRFKNSREFLVSRMLRGGWGITINNDDFTVTESTANGGSPTHDVSMQIPAGNLSQLNMLGGGNILGSGEPWDNASGARTINHCLEINAAFEQLHGYPLRHVWVSSVVMGYLLAQDELQATGGTANIIFESFTPDGTQRSVDGIPGTGFVVVFRALPWLKFHVYDGGLEAPTDGTFSKLVPDTKAIFLPEPDSAWVGWAEGSEVVAENLMDQGREVFGFHAWSTRAIDPAGWELKAVDNGMPVLYLPKCVAYGTVDY